MNVPDPSSINAWDMGFVNGGGCDQEGRRYYPECQYADCGFEMPSLRDGQGFQLQTDRVEYFEYFLWQLKPEPFLLDGNIILISLTEANTEEVAVLLAVNLSQYV